MKTNIMTAVVSKGKSITSLIAVPTFWPLPVCSGIMRVVAIKCTSFQGIKQRGAMLPRCFMLTLYISVHYGASIISSQSVNQIKKRALEKLG